MQNKLDARIAALPEGVVLSPLRKHWPGLCAAAFKMSDSVWSVAVVSSSKIENWQEVAISVDQILTDLELGSYIRHRKVCPGYYVFQLVEFPGQGSPDRVRGL